MFKKGSQFWKRLDESVLNQTAVTKLRRKRFQLGRATSSQVMKPSEMRFYSWVILDVNMMIGGKILNLQFSLGFDIGSQCWWRWREPRGRDTGLLPVFCNIKYKDTLKKISQRKDTANMTMLKFERSLLKPFPTQCSGYDFSEVIILWTGATRYWHSILWKRD